MVPQHVVQRNLSLPRYIWMSVVGAALLIGIAPLFSGSAAGDVYPVGDSAMLEIYTRHAARGIWPLGPYSQFGWHHPGPLYFYLLAPLYLLAGEKTVALHAGAFAINLLSLCAIAGVLIRYATPGVACAAGAAIGLFLFRVQPVMSSFWNPHVVVLPAAAFMVLCAALAAGHRGALPAVVLSGSFLAQTHISLAPYVLLLSIAALGATAWPTTNTQAHGRSLGWWMLLSASLLLLLWVLPIAEQLSGTPGNVTRLLRFFADASPGQELRTALAAWGDAICALLDRRITVPEGLPLQIRTGAISTASAWAIVQILLLAIASLDALRRQDRFDAALSAAGLLASVVALWSITRVKSLVGDYMVFWMSAVGALNWGVLAGLALTRLAGTLRRPMPRWAALGASALLVSWFVYAGSDQLKRARRQGLSTPRGSARVVKLASEAVLEDMTRRHVRRPLFQMSTRDWGEAAGVLLQVYKRGAPPAVDATLVPFFGGPFAPDGREDRVFVIADATSHASLAQRPGDELVASVEGMYIHAGPIARNSSTDGGKD